MLSNCARTILLGNPLNFNKNGTQLPIIPASKGWHCV